MAKFNAYELRLRQKVFAAYNYRCAACGSGTDLEIDHTRPRKVLLAMGIDLNDIRYWQCLCHHCNNKKNGTDEIPKLEPIELTQEELDILTKAEAIINNKRALFARMLEQHRQANT